MYTSEVYTRLHTLSSHVHTLGAGWVRPASLLLKYPPPSSRILNKSLKSQGGLTIRAVKEGKGKRRSRQKSGRRGTAGAAWC